MKDGKEARGEIIHVEKFPPAQSRVFLPSTDVRDPVPDIDGGGVDIRSIIDILIRRKWIVFSCVTTVFVSVLVISLIMTPLYQARGSLKVDPAQVKVTKFEDITTSQLRSYEFVKTQVDLLRSPTLAMRVTEKLELDKNPEFNPYRKEGFKNTIKQAFSFFKKAESDEVKKLKENNLLLESFMEGLEVVGRRDSSLIEVAFTHSNPVLASQIVNTLLGEFIEWQMDQKIQSSGIARQQLEKQIKDAKIKLEKSEEALNDFAKKAGIVSLDSKLNIIYRQLEEINKALSETHAARIAKESLYEQVKRGEFSSLPEVIGNQLIQQLKKDLVETTAEYERLTPIYKPDYPQLKSIASKIEDIKTKIATEEQRIARSIQRDYQRIIETEQRLEEAAQKKKQEAMDLNDRATQYRILEREVETNKQIYQSLLERAREIEANVGTGVSNIEIVDRATIPVKPFSPNLRLNLIVSLLAGIFLGIGGAFLMERLDNTLKKVEDLSDRYGFTLLGILPVVDPEDVEKLDKMVVEDSRVPFSECIRTVKASLDLSVTSKSGEPPRIITVTSVGPNEGKSTVSSNISLCYSGQETKKVVLIDADMRKPRLHRVFLNHYERKNTAGLSSYLSGGASLDEIIYKTDYPNLFFIPAGPIPPNPAELLASYRMKKLLEKLRTVADHIIIDSPPSAGFADILILANVVDGIVLVSSIGETNKDALRIFKRSMMQVNAPILGCVVNKVPLGPKYGSYGYYYRYSYYYRHYSYYSTADNHAAIESKQEDPGKSNIKKPA